MFKLKWRTHFDRNANNTGKHPCHLQRESRTSFLTNMTWVLISHLPFFMDWDAGPTLPHSTAG